MLTFESSLLLQIELCLSAWFPLRGYESRRKHMEEKTYTLTEKELFDLLEYETNTAIGGTSKRAVVDYNADQGMMDVFTKAFVVMLSIGLTPTTEEISDAFHKYRNEKGKAE